MKTTYGCGCEADIYTGGFLGDFGRIDKLCEKHKQIAERLEEDDTRRMDNPLGRYDDDH